MTGDFFWCQQQMFELFDHKECFTPDSETSDSPPLEKDILDTLFDKLDAVLGLDLQPVFSDSDGEPNDLFDEEESDCHYYYQVDDVSDDEAKCQSEKSSSNLI